MDKKYIDAEHFKRRVMVAAFKLNDNVMYNVAKAICEMVDFESAADVAPVVHGEWIVNPKREYDYICSVCGGDAPEDRWRNNAIPTPYCPNCGAKMDGGTP